jgi:hypothetical protein
MYRLFSFLLFMLFLFAAACTTVPETGLQPGVQEPLSLQPVTLPTSLVQDASAVPQETGTTPQPTNPSSAPLPNMEDEYFAQDVASAIVRRDYAAMQSAMGERFIIAYWRSEGSELAAGEAIETLRSFFFNQGSDPVTDVGIDLAPLLEGNDPLRIFGPKTNAIKAFHITGLGSNAAGQAIAVIARNPATGVLYWHGILAGVGDQPESTTDLDSFSERLKTAIEWRDFNALRGLMRERFSIVTWNTQLIEVTSEEALQQLSQDKLAVGSSPVVILGTDVTSMLQGKDPLAEWGPTANTVKAVHVMGLGQGSNEEAVLVIGRASTGEFYWHGIMLPVDGYFHMGKTEGSLEELPTEVEYVMALDNVNVRSGPGLNYAVEGMVHEGQIAKVSGISLDRAWWRILCTQDASGYCWISADPKLTEATTSP